MEEVAKGSEAGDGEERRDDGSYLIPMTGTESSSVIMMDGAGEPELLWT